MSQGPLPDSTNQPSTGPESESAQRAGVPQQSPVPPQHAYPQQPWGTPPAVPVTPRLATGPGLAVVSVVLGFLGCVVWLLPIDETGTRHYLPIPFALGGLALGIAGLVGNRRGKPVAAVGVLLSTIALLLGIFMVGLEVLHGLG